MVGKRATNATAPPVKDLASQVLILDNGSHTIKAGFSLPGSQPTLEECHVIPNCIARSQRDKITYVGADLDSCADYGELQIKRPIERGYLVGWESEKVIWDRTFLDERSTLRCDPHSTNLILTEAPHAPSALQRHADEMVFEEYGFASLYRTAASNLNAFVPTLFSASGLSGLDSIPAECLLVVDVGHSHTTVTPLYHGRPLDTACRRLEIGGRLLTNHLKGLLSRTMDMQREEWIAQEIKEDTCYVASDASDFDNRLERVWKGGQKDPREIDSSIVVDYVLPDYEQLKRGYARPHDPSKSARMRRLGIGGTSEMVIPVGNERFTVPELLFSPRDIGMQQEGIPGTILQSLQALPKGLWQSFLASVLVVGGTSRLPGFIERLERDLRSRLDASYAVKVVHAEDPIRNAWLGGANMAQNEALLRGLAVTRAEYIEHGDLWTRRRFVNKFPR